MSLLGYRWWYAGCRPNAGWRLRSLFIPRSRPLWWAGPHLTATVPPHLECPPRCPGASGSDCRCGIHAFRTERLAWHQPPPAPPWHALWGDWAVLGEVALWGKVVEHEDGYRAEHAMVRRLIVPARLVIRASLLDLTQASLCCLQVDDEVIDVETTEHAPEPGMAEVLARVAEEPALRVGKRSARAIRVVARACCSRANAAFKS